MSQCLVCGIEEHVARQNFNLCTHRIEVEGENGVVTGIYIDVDIKDEEGELITLCPKCFSLILKHLADDVYSKPLVIPPEEHHLGGIQ